MERSGTLGSRTKMGLALKEQKIRDLLLQMNQVCSRSNVVDLFRSFGICNPPWRMQFQQGRFREVAA
jgi:hypothetical protein